MAPSTRSWLSVETGSARLGGASSASLISPGRLDHDHDLAEQRLKRRLDLALGSGGRQFVLSRDEGLHPKSVSVYAGYKPVNGSVDQKLVECGNRVGSPWWSLNGQPYLAWPAGSRPRPRRTAAQAPP